MHKKIVIEPYGWTVNVYTQSSLEEYKKAERKLHAPEHEIIYEVGKIEQLLCEGGACCGPMSNGRGWAIFLPDDYKESVVWHEALHTVIHMIKDSDQPLVLPDIEEQLAYMQGYVVYQIRQKVYGIKCKRHE